MWDDLGAGVIKANHYDFCVDASLRRLPQHLYKTIGCVSDIDYESRSAHVAGVEHLPGKFEMQASDYKFAVGIT
jgi:hypothetical protein